MNSISADLNLMIRASIKASKVLIRDFGEIEKLQVSEKGPGNFVTASDKRVEKIIIDELSNSEYTILSEERGIIEGKTKEEQDQLSVYIGKNINETFIDFGSLSIDMTLVFGYSKIFFV